MPDSSIKDTFNRRRQSNRLMFHKYRWYRKFKPICIIWPKEQLTTTDYYQLENKMKSLNVHGKTSIADNQLENKMKSLNVREIDSSIADNDIDWESSTNAFGQNQRLIRLHDVARNILEIQSPTTFGQQDVLTVRTILQNNPDMEELEIILEDSDIQSYTSQVIDARSTSVLPEVFTNHYAASFTTGDGNCFFSAISIQIFGTED